MKEEKTQQQKQHYEGGDMSDLRQFFTPPPPTLFPSSFTNQYDVSMMLPMGAHPLQGANIISHGFRSPPTPTPTPTPTITTSASFADVDAGATARWPRQETLTLLEIRSRLDHKFKEANHKGPLWDDLSRIMCEEHGYQRSGKKCREKFENLYKYYKKTRDGKAGKHDGKSYRFFRQLEALYGESCNTTTSITNHLNMVDNSYNMITSTNTSRHHHIATNEGGQCNNMVCNIQDGFQSVSLSNHSPSDFDYTSSSESEKEGSMEQGESSRRSWNEKIKEFIGSQMRKMMEKQEAWLENVVRTLEHKEQERVCREEEWRRQETQRMEREHKFWAEERAWIEARDKALIEALQRIIASKEACHDHQKQQHSQEGEDEESEFKIAVDKAKDNNNKVCCSKKRKVNCNIQMGDHFSSNLYKVHGEMNSQGGMGLDPQEKDTMNESCLRMLLRDGGLEGIKNHLWDQSYGASKLNKG